MAKTVCEKCGSTSNLTRHHIVPKMFSVHLRMKGNETFNRTLLFKTACLCRKCHNEYELKYADILKYDLCVHLQLAMPGAGDTFITDRLLAKMKTYANEYFRKGTNPTLKEKIMRFFQKVLDVPKVTKKLIKKFRNIQCCYFNPKYKRYEDVLPTVDRMGFIRMWRNDFYNWLNFA